MTLDNGTVWRVRPNGVDVVAAWQPGDSIAVGQSDNQIYQHRLTNQETGEFADVVRSAARI